MTVVNTPTEEHFEEDVQIRDRMLVLDRHMKEVELIIASAHACLDEMGAPPIPAPGDARLPWRATNMLARLMYMKCKVHHERNRD